MSCVSLTRFICGLQWRCRIDALRGNFTLTITLRMYKQCKGFCSWRDFCPWLVPSTVGWHWFDLFIVHTKYYAGEVCWFLGMFKFVVKLRFTTVKNPLFCDMDISLVILLYIVCMYACALTGVCTFMNTHIKYVYTHQASTLFQLSVSIRHGQFPAARIHSPPKQWGAAFALLVNEGKQAYSGGQLQAVDIAPWLPVVLGRASLSQGLLGREWASLGSSCQCWEGEGKGKEQIK